MVDFAQVISVRERKADTARKNEGAAMAACDVARVAVQEAEQDVEDFSDEIKDLEVRLLTELLNTRMTKYDLDVMHNKLKQARDRAHELVHLVQDARSELSQKEHVVEVVRQKAIQANSKLKRITEFDKKLSEIEVTNSLKEEDALMDEFAEIISARRNI